MKRKIAAVILLLSLFMCACNSTSADKAANEVDKTEKNQRNEISDSSQVEQEDEIEQEENKEELIQEQLKAAEDYYSQVDFVQVAACYDQLDQLDYDTNELRVILEYDKNNYEDAKKCYDTLKNVKEKLESNDYDSLSSLVESLKEMTAKLDAFENNKDSKIGTYISNIRNNPNYLMFKAQILENDDINFDGELTAPVYAQIIIDYITDLLQEEFPYLSEEEESSNMETREYALEDILDAIEAMGTAITEQTETVHIVPNYDPMDGNTFYCFETTDTFTENISSSGKTCDVNCIFVHSLTKKFYKFYFFLHYSESIGFDILNFKVSNGVTEVVFGQENLENTTYSMYVPCFNSENLGVDEAQEKADKLHEMATGQEPVTLTFQGAGQEEHITMTEEQKESMSYITELWQNVLIFYQ